MRYAETSLRIHASKSRAITWVLLFSGRTMK